MTPTEDCATIVSVHPLELNEFKPGLYPGTFKIPASNGEPSLVVVSHSIHYVDVGEDRPQLRVIIPAREIARALVDDFVASQLAVTEDTKPGLTWLHGNVSLAELRTKHVAVLSQLRIQQRNWFLALVKLADDDWSRYHKHVVISDISRLAAKALGYTKDWLVVPENLPSQKCPACASSVISGIVVCPNCRCVLDAEKYSKLQFAK